MLSLVVVNQSTFHGKQLTEGTSHFSSPFCLAKGERSITHVGFKVGKNRAGVEIRNSGLEYYRVRASDD